jgi:hypothetical protein
MLREIKNTEHAALWKGGNLEHVLDFQCVESDIGKEAR